MRTQRPVSAEKRGASGKWRAFLTGLLAVCLAMAVMNPASAAVEPPSRGMEQQNPADKWKDLADRIFTREQFAETVTELSRDVIRRPVQELMPHTFEDVTDPYYDQYITYTVNMGLFMGHDSTTFGFGEKLTMKQFAAVMLRLLDINVSWDEVESKAIELGLVPEGTDFNASSTGQDFIHAMESEPLKNVVEAGNGPELPAIGKMEIGRLGGGTGTPVAELEIGQSVLLSVKVWDADGNEIGDPDRLNGEAGVEVVAESPLKASAVEADPDGTTYIRVTAEDGAWFAGIRKAAVLLRAKDTAVEARAEIAVRGLDPERITVHPARGTIKPGEELSFRAEVVDRKRGEVTDVPVTWHASGGTVDDKGTFTADVPGLYRIAAVLETDESAGAGELEGAAWVLVEGVPDAVLPTRYVTVTTPSAPASRISFGQVSDLENNEGDAVFVDLSASANVPVTYSAVGLPPGLAIDPATGAISGVPSHGISEGPDTVFRVVVIAAEQAPGREAAAVAFNWTIRDSVPSVNVPPVWRDISPALSVYESGQTFSIDLSQYVYDPNGDLVEMAGLVVEADGVQVIPSSFSQAAPGVLEIERLIPGTYHVVLYAFDSAGHAASVAFTIEVTP